jgi:hypothetical protein
LLVKLDGSGFQVINLLLVEAMRMATTGFEQSGNRDFGHFGQSRSGTHTTPFVEMVNDCLGFGFSHFGVEQGGVSSFREFFMATTAA